jgi:restriction system protein
MAREKTSPLEDIIMLASHLPWWICIVLALVSYLVLHGIASVPAVPVKNVNKELASSMTHGFLTGLAMFGQYILPFVFILAAIVSGIGSIKRKKLYERVESRSGVAALNEISWEDFERLVGEYFRRQGFQVTRQGGNGSDGGIDLILRKDKEMHLVQCKQWKAFKVGVQPVREFYGVLVARGAAGGYFVTSGIYTDDAQEFARGLNITLIDGQKLRNMIDVARQQPKVVPLIKKEFHQITPTCPKCGAAMKKRVARQGKYTGKEFWGCTAFPKCNGTLPLETYIVG